MKRSKFLIIFGLAWLVFGIPFMLLGRHILNLDARYASEGIKATATVLGKRVEEKWNSKEKRNDISYYITYKFSPEGAPALESSASVSRDQYDKSSENAPIEVEYLKAEPEKSRLVGNNDKVMGFVMLGVGGLLTLIGCVCLYIDIKARRKINRLMASGILGQGTITGIQHSNLTINNVRQLQIKYSFKDGTGRAFEGVSDTMAPSIADAWKTGDKGQIRYDRSSPNENIWLGKKA